ncbi:MAG: helix-turn-helix domain-containing protein [Candidatus Phosphoribacter sp.]|nr:AraC family transcriptional regulator [Actinomycetales bacterium]
MEFTYRTRAPGDRLSRFVEVLWYARGTIGYRRERIAPTGSCVAVVVLGDPIIETPSATGVPLLATGGFLIGPHDGPVLNEPTGETYAVGVVLTPIGCRSVFGLDPATLRGDVVDLGTAWPRSRPLRTALLQESDPEAILTVLAATLEEQLDDAGPGLDLCDRAVALLDAEPTVEIGALARHLGVSHGHLDREFVRVVGLTPRALARILRLRRVLATVDVFGEVTWTSLAADWGWFDQSHFIRDFKRHTGVTPSEYVRAQRAEFAADDAAPGFVPDT